MDSVQWFFIILLADLAAAAIVGGFNWKKILKKKRKYRARRSLKVIPLRKEG